MNLKGKVILFLMGAKSYDRTVLVGTGEHSIFRKTTRIIMRDGATYDVREISSPKKNKKMLDDRIDDVFYSKPEAFVKKLKRKITK